MNWGQWFFCAILTLCTILMAGAAIVTWKPAREAISTGTATQDLSTLATAGVISLILGGIAVVLKERGGRRSP